MSKNSLFSLEDDGGGFMKDPRGFWLSNIFFKGILFNPFSFFFFFRVSQLENIFSPSTKEAQGNTSLNYKAPKQPKAQTAFNSRSSTDTGPKVDEQPAVIFGTAPIQLYFL